MLSLEGKVERHQKKTPEEWDRLRQLMVDTQIRARGVTDSNALDAMRKVPRHRFVPPSLEEQAYGDYPLPIGEGQTISQPYIVGVMAQYAAIDSSSSVLEIGTGSGYAAAVLAEIADRVYTIERVPALAKRAANVLQELGYTRIEAICGDGTLGWPEKAPFDAIIVTAGAPVIPEELTRQLKPGGRLVIPVGDQFSQELLVVRKGVEEGIFQQEVKEFVRFVPLIGEQGW